APVIDGREYLTSIYQHVDSAARAKNPANNIADKKCQTVFLADDGRNLLCHSGGRIGCPRKVNPLLARFGHKVEATLRESAADWSDVPRCAYHGPSRKLLARTKENKASDRHHRPLEASIYDEICGHCRGDR